MNPYQDRLFDIEPQKDISGKNLDALLDSRQKRERILRLFNGNLPQSIMIANKRTREDDIARGGYEESEWRSEDGNKMLDSIFGISGKGTKNGALSIFPQNIGDAM